MRLRGDAARDGIAPAPPTDRRALWRSRHSAAHSARCDRQASPCPRRAAPRSARPAAVCLTYGVRGARERGCIADKVEGRRGDGPRPRSSSTAGLRARLTGAAFPRRRARCRRQRRLRSAIRRPCTQRSGSRAASARKPSRNRAWNSASNFSKRAALSPRACVRARPVVGSRSMISVRSAAKSPNAASCNAAHLFHAEPTRDSLIDEGGIGRSGRTPPSGRPRVPARWRARCDRRAPPETGAFRQRRPALGAAFHQQPADFLGAGRTARLAREHRPRGHATFSASARRSAWVDLPAPSPPSSVMKRPRISLHSITRRASFWPAACTLSSVASAAITSCNGPMRTR